MSPVKHRLPRGHGEDNPPSLVPTEGRNTEHENSVVPYNPLLSTGLASSGKDSIQCGHGGGG